MCPKRMFYPPCSPVFLFVMDQIIWCFRIFFFYNFFQTRGYKSFLFGGKNCESDWIAILHVSWQVSLPVSWMPAEDASLLGQKQKTLLLRAARVSTFSCPGSHTPVPTEWCRKCQITPSHTVGCFSRQELQLRESKSFIRDAECTLPAPEGHPVQGCSFYKMTWNKENPCLCVQDMQKGKRSAKNSLPMFGLKCFL